MKLLKNKCFFQSLKSCMFFVVLGCMIFGLSACENYTSYNSSEDILTQKVISKERTPITVLVKYAFSINDFEKAVEEKFPDIDIIQVGNYTRDIGVAEYEKRLEHDDLTDIVMTWPIDIGEEYWDDRLIDLSGMSFTSRYNISMLNSISKDGKLHYLPGPAQVRGIVYNKTMFEENGWQVPQDFDGFVELCKTIEKSGIRSIQLPFGNSEVLDTAFVGYSYADCFSKPRDVQWLTDYNNGNGSFGEQFGPALDTFQKMIDEGIWKESDLDVYYSDREKMLFTRECAMIEDSVLMARMGLSMTGITDEFALMPFFNPGVDADWGRLYMVCYIGLNKNLLESKNKEKYDLVLELMDYISTPEGQAALSGDTGAMFSSVYNVSPPNIPEIKDLLPALEHGRYAVFPVLERSQSALREGLRGMLRGDMTKDDVVRMVDEQNKFPIQTEVPKSIGVATADFSVIETGNFVTDVMRAYSECEIALFLDNGKDGKYNGKGISASFYSGDLTKQDIERILPDLKHGEKGTLWKVAMTGEDLLKTLENSIKVDNNIGGWFYYFSGLKMKYDPTAKPGERIIKITTDDAEPIDLEKIYSIAVMDETVPEEYLKSCEETDVLISDILVQFIESSKEISPSGDGRFVVAK